MTASTRWAWASSSGGSLGRIRLRKMAIMVASTTEDEPNTVVTQPGKPGPAREPLTCVTPIPRATESPTTVEERMVNFWEVIMRMPVMVIMANTDTVAPPMTLWGMVVRTEENLGTRPATSRTAAARVKTRRLITRLTVTMPTFWL